jgi:hypothetical protein
MVRQFSHNTSISRPRRPGFEPGPVHVRFVAEKVAFGLVLSEYFGFPCKFSLGSLLQTHHRPFAMKKKREKWVVVRDTTGGGNGIYHRF